MKRVPYTVRRLTHCIPLVVYEDLWPSLTFYQSSFVMLMLNNLLHLSIGYRDPSDRLPTIDRHRIGIKEIGVFWAGCCMPCGKAGDGLWPLEWLLIHLSIERAFKKKWNRYLIWQFWKLGIISNDDLENKVSINSNDEDFTKRVSTQITLFYSVCQMWYRFLKPGITLNDHL